LKVGNTVEIESTRAAARKQTKVGQNILRETSVGLGRRQKYTKYNKLNNNLKTLGGKIAARGEGLHTPSLLLVASLESIQLHLFFIRTIFKNTRLIFAQNLRTN